MEVISTGRGRATSLLRSKADIGGQDQDRVELEVVPWPGGDYDAISVRKGLAQKTATK